MKLNREYLIALRMIQLCKKGIALGFTDGPDDSFFKLLAKYQSIVDSFASRQPKRKESKLL